MSDLPRAELEHKLVCSTCGKVAQTGFIKHTIYHEASPGVTCTSTHWNTIKARELRVGDVVRPAVGNVAIRITGVSQEEHEGAWFTVAVLSTGLVMVCGADDDVPLMLREQWL